MSEPAPRNRKERRTGGAGNRKERRTGGAGNLTERREAEARRVAAHVRAMRKAFKGSGVKTSKRQAATGAKSGRSDAQRRGRLAQLDSRVVQTPTGKERLVTGAAAVEELKRIERGGSA